MAQKVPMIDLSCLRTFFDHPYLWIQPMPTLHPQSGSSWSAFTNLRLTHKILHLCHCVTTRPWTAWWISSRAGSDCDGSQARSTTDKDAPWTWLVERESPTWEIWEWTRWGHFELYQAVYVKHIYPAVISTIMIWCLTIGIESQMILIENHLSSAEQSGDNLIQQNAPTMLSSSPSSLNDDGGAVHRKWAESTEKVVFSISQCERLFRTTNLTISCPLPGVWAFRRGTNAKRAVTQSSSAISSPNCMIGETELTDLLQQIVIIYVYTPHLQVINLSSSHEDVTWGWLHILRWYEAGQVVVQSG